MQAHHSPYILIIGASLIVIISYLFTLISRRTNIPSVLLLMFLGFGIKEAIVFGVANLEPYQSTIDEAVKFLGNVGLVMIVLEAALDLKITRDKLKLLLQASFVALGALLATSLGVAYLLIFTLHIDMFQAMAYAIPLSIMSSAIIIPSVKGMDEFKKEFMVYESTLSDILGIIFFQFYTQAGAEITFNDVFVDLFLNVLLTSVTAIAIGLGLTWLLQKIRTDIKLFLIISFLLMMFAIGKLLHASSLLIILIFGLILRNHELVFRNKIKFMANNSVLSPLVKDFHTLTLETAFLVRTFFFVVFGMTISVASFFNLQTVLISTGIVGVIFLVRYVFLKATLRKNFRTQLFIAPRGLITILLFFAIPTSHQIPHFDSGILLISILVSSLIMTFALIANKNTSAKQVSFSKIPMPLMQDGVDEKLQSHHTNSAISSNKNKTKKSESTPEENTQNDSLDN